MKIKRTMEGCHDVVCPYCRSSRLETQCMGHGPLWDPNLKSCTDCDYQWTQKIPSDRFIEAQEALPEMPEMPPIDERSVVLWAKDRTVQRLARMHLTTATNVRNILRKHGATAKEERWVSRVYWPSGK